MENIKQINRLNDLLFRKYMGEKGDEEQLAAFLNEVLKKTGKDNITDLRIVEETQLPPDYQGDKAGILDVLAKIGNTKVNVEVQLRNEHNMDKRTLFYCSRLLTEGFEEGQNYMNLPDVIAVNILNFEQYPELINFHNVIHLWDDTFKVKIDPLEIHLLELIKLGNENNVLNIEIPLHQWGLYFKQSTTMEMINKLKDMNPAIMKAEMKIQKALSDESTRRAYFLREKARNDYVSAMDNAIRTGIQQGKLEGIQQGMQQKEREMILDGLRLGIPMETIAQMAKQPLEYVRELIK